MIHTTADAARTIALLLGAPRTIREEHGGYAVTLSEGNRAWGSTPSQLVTAVRSTLRAA